MMTDTNADTDYVLRLLTQIKHLKNEREELGKALLELNDRIATLMAERLKMLHTLDNMHSMLYEDKK